MNPSLFEIGAAIIMVAVSLAMVVSFSRYMAAASESRMMHMLARAGVAPEVAERGDAGAILRDVRSRCRSCPSEDLCDRWLAGKVEGANSFCPNAQVLGGLTRTTGRAAL